VRELLFLAEIHEAELREAREGGEGSVLAAIHGEDKALTFPVFGQEAETGIERGGDIAEGEFLAIDPDAAGGLGIKAEDGLGNFTTTRTDEASEAEDFTGAEGEVDIMEFAG